MMQFTFLDMAGKTLFLRNDAERAQWTQEEMTLDLELPRLADKVANIGQRILFFDPSTGSPQIYEIKQAKTLEPDHYQSIVAEHICISELTDDHIEKAEITNKKASEALATVLTGTLWHVGNVSIDPESSLDVSRGSVWQAVLQIKTNWNVYIEPRVKISANGTITRYLDILPTAGVWNGLRLSVDKNMLSPAVTFDDSNVVTAMYGYGGTTTPTKKGEEEKEINFAEIIWQKTDEHPAKPAGQTYLEDADATAEYGRNGRPRFGFYQNTDILEPDILIQKTWEALDAASKPDISIDGTVADLYRMGYADEPIKLHDIALVEVQPAGYKAQLQIIRMTTDLLDPSETTVTIGKYIPNIIYIERDTAESVTGGRGGGGNKSDQPQRSEYETAIEKNNRMIQLRAYQNDLDDLDNEVKLQEARITIEHDRITQEVTDRRDADNVLNASITVQADRITQEVTQRKGETEALSSRITIQADRITQEVTDRTNADTTLQSNITQTAESITAEVTRAKAAEGELSGRLTVTSDAITAEVTRAKTAEGDLSGRITVNADAITAEVTRASTAEGELSGRLTVTSEAITAEVTRATTQEGTLSAKLDVAADRITAEVTRAEKAEGELSGRITVTSEAVTAEVERATDAEGSLSGRITVNADAITAEVTRATDNETVLASSIRATSDAITAEVTRATGEETTLAGRLTITESAITQEVTDRTSADSALSGRITVNANNITAEVSRATDAEDNLSGLISVNADNITAEVTRASDAEGALSGRITVNADAITAEVTRAKANENTLSGRITVNADKVALVVEEKDGENVVKASSIVAGINAQTGSYVKITADTINLSGYVTASQLSATTAKIDNLMAGNTTAAWIKANQGNIPSLTVGNNLTFKGSGVYWQSANINGTNYHFMGYVG